MTNDILRVKVKIIEDQEKQISNLEGENETLIEAAHEACDHSKGLYARIAELEHNEAETERLKHVINGILHPNGDGPKNPSWCDIASFIRTDLNP